MASGPRRATILCSTRPWLRKWPTGVPARMIRCAGASPGIPQRSCAPRKGPAVPARAAAVPCSSGTAWPTARIPGPTANVYRKKMRRHALRIALSNKVREESVTVIDTVSMDEPKTRYVKDMVSALGLSGGTLVVTEESNPVFLKSASNVQDVMVMPAPELNPLEATAARNLLITRDAVRVVDSMWGDGGAS